MSESWRAIKLTPMLGVNLKLISEVIAVDPGSGPVGRKGGLGRGAGWERDIPGCHLKAGETAGIYQVTAPQPTTKSFCLLEYLPL